MSRFLKFVRVNTKYIRYCFIILILLPIRPLNTKSQGRRTSVLNVKDRFPSELLFSAFTSSQDTLETDLKITMKNLREGFQNPPESAKPRVWWHWMNGNISKEGIKADLEWMKRIGIGGFQNFNLGLKTPQIVKNRLIYMTPEWKDAFRYATKLADSLKLEMGIVGSPGWGQSGGVWIPPAQAMKKLVWSEIKINGGETFKGKLPKPPTTTGGFQNIPTLNRITPSLPLPEYYADAAVVAYRIPKNDVSFFELNPNVTSSAGKFELSTLIDGDLANSAFLPLRKQDVNAWINFSLTKPIEINSLTIAVRDFYIPGLTGIEFKGTLEKSDDGIRFEKVEEIAISRNRQRTFAFKPVSAKFFRVSFLNPVKPSTISSITGKDVKPAGIHLSEIYLHSIAQVNRFEDKAGFTASDELYNFATLPVADANVIKKTDVIDLTSRMKMDGSLEWTPPTGRWAIIRFGYSLTGHQNGAASPESTGLEVDKLNADYVKDYFNTHLDQYKDASGGLMGKRGIQYLITDSWEAGVQNWTNKMIEEFSKHCGYDMLSWMPVLTGKIVESAEASDRFLWDFRKSIGDLTVENHYDQLTTILEKRNIKRYSESHESGRAFIGDGMEVKRKADIPMGALWMLVPTNNDTTAHKADLLETASVAHIYGQNLAAAESLTCGGRYAYTFSPETLKPTADMELAMGINRFFIHTSVHQPVFDKIPGLGFMRNGQWFTRNETWAEQAKSWTSYLGRSSFMLQQGKFVADIIYYYGENNNITALYKNNLPKLPIGFNYDFVNADALLNMLSVKNGSIITPSGMNYRLLVLDSNSQYMSLPVLLKIRDMVNEGAVVVGPKPFTSPSLSDDVTEFRTVVNQLWPNGKKENKFGKGKVYGSQTVSEVLKSLNMNPDFEYTTPKNDAELLFVHRKLPDADIYWVNNRNNRKEDVEAIFRVKGKIPEIWNPVTGKIGKASYVIKGERTIVTLNLEPNDAVFVVFNKKANANSFVLPKKKETVLKTISGPWKIAFQPERGAPAEATLHTLVSWSESSDSGIKYFSGTAVYTKKIQALDSWFKDGNQLWMDMGGVKNIAEVLINGNPLGIIWKVPFRVNVTNALKVGENNIEIKVTNLWVNRLIGDLQPNLEKKYTYNNTETIFNKDTPLLPSGLLGPVQILTVNHK